MISARIAASLARQLPKATRQVMLKPLLHPATAKFNLKIAYFRCNEQLKIWKICRFDFDILTGRVASHGNHCLFNNTSASFIHDIPSYCLSATYVIKPFGYLERLGFTFQD